MTLPSQQRSNRAKIIEQYSSVAVVNEDLVDGYSMKDAGPFLDTLTEETWKNSGEAMLERVREALQSSGVMVQGLKSDGDLLAVLVKFEANQDSIAVYDNLKLLAALTTLTSERTNS